MDQTKEHLRKVSALGPELVCASRGTAGSIAYDGKNFYKQGIEPVEVMIDTMAAGDSLLTAFLVNYISARAEWPRNNAKMFRESGSFCGPHMWRSWQLGTWQDLRIGLRRG